MTCKFHQCTTYQATAAVSAKIRAKIDEIAAFKISLANDALDDAHDDAEAGARPTLPVLETAVQAVKSLSKNDMTELRSLPTPLPLVQKVMEAVCVIFEQVRKSNAIHFRTLLHGDTCCVALC